MDDALFRPPARGTVRVLLADDDPWIRESFGFVLRDAGYEVLEAADGMDALDTLLLSPHPLVVVLDLLMPRMTGFDVLARMAADADLSARHACIVCSSEARTPEQIGPHFARLLDRLSISYVSKPCDIDDLLAAVSMAAERLFPRDASGQHSEPA